MGGAPPQVVHLARASPGAGVAWRARRSEAAGMGRRRWRLPAPPSSAPDTSSLPPARPGLRLVLSSSPPTG